MTGDLLSIGEFARRVGLSVSAVRFYADRGVLLPAHVDPSTGYRSFAEEQLGLGCLLRDLRLIGVPLSEVKTALSSPEPDVQRMVAQHIASLELDLVRARDVAASLGATGAATEPPASTQPTTVVSVADFVAALDQVIPLAATNAELPHLMAVLIEAKEGSLRLVATDTHRLAVRDLVTVSTGAEFTALVPVATLRRCSAQFDLSEELAITVDGNELCFSTDGSTTRGRVIPATFPDYEPHLIRHDPTARLIGERSMFIDALLRFDDSTGAVLLQSQERSTRLVRREVELEIAVEREGSSIDVAFDPALALECVVGAVGPEVVLEVEEDQSRPMAVRSATNGTDVSLLMPYKLD